MGLLYIKESPGLIPVSLLYIVYRENIKDILNLIELYLEFYIIEVSFEKTDRITTNTRALIDYIAI